MQRSGSCVANLAATFRLSAREKWNEGIGNHNSAMIPGTKYMLINPRGMIFSELRASDLIVCDLDGNVISGKGELRKVAHFIHARIHRHASAKRRSCCTRIRPMRPRCR